ncbi:enoyl-CoA hydratase/isomerase family protein [Arachidicoccus ginsenosidivorans]|uniref:enoyl-CoA hydratase/isomerase family protein n=1 Tax=Arachidicoccus ginsenosidivorans TaxID=496057 RepID=UPI0021D341AF|nr:enoyl-CoA hydratase-related protein [Arachidicoccus ginsenosidivorans]
MILLRSVQHDVFCSGAYFNELLEIKDQKAAQTFFMGFAEVIKSMRKCAKLIVARVHGKVVGGGLGLVAAADYAIALEGADVRLSELSIGIGPYVIAPAMVRKMGLSSFSQLAIDAHLWRNSDWARRKGLYAELHPNKASLEESIERLTTSLSKILRRPTPILKRCSGKTPQIGIIYYRSVLPRPENCSCNNRHNSF